jgi:hypothetical protein
MSVRIPGPWPCLVLPADCLLAIHELLYAVSQMAVETAQGFCFIEKISQKFVRLKHCNTLRVAHSIFRFKKNRSMTALTILCQYVKQEM